MVLVASVNEYTNIEPMPSYTRLKKKVNEIIWSKDFFLFDQIKRTSGTIKKAFYFIIENTYAAFMLQQFANPVTKTLLYHSTLILMILAKLLKIHDDIRYLEKCTFKTINILLIF